MTKHNEYNVSPSIMEPVSETPLLTIQAEINDAMKSATYQSSHAPNYLQDLLDIDDDDAPPRRPQIRPSSSGASFQPLSAPATIPPIQIRPRRSKDHPQYPVQTPSSPHRYQSPMALTDVYPSASHRSSISSGETAAIDGLSDELRSINMHYEKSFLLMDGNEELHIPTADLFCRKLGCAEDTNLKVVAIFGNTGDGKSHTMNHTFFGGEEIFRTSSAQDSCTLGVWAALQSELGVLCLDTEGLLGDTPNESQRMRMLLKVLAISDVIVYRTRSERLHSDMFSFLGTASKAFHRHFSSALLSLGLPGTSQALGPAVIIFHETRNTKTVEANHEKSAEDILRDRFGNMKIDLESFSSLKYVGIQTSRPPTDYGSIQRALHKEVMNTTVRSPRWPTVIYKAIEALNLKFSGTINERTINPFPEQYFTCGVHCESCQQRCDQSMGHAMEGKPHRNALPCRYQHQFENKVLLCKQCHQNGREVIVKITTTGTQDQSWMSLAKYAWSGSVIECINCGEIFRSRQYWYGNKLPEEAAVRTDIVHIWKSGMNVADGPTYSAQMVLDGVNYLSDAVCSISAQPSKALTEWVADQIAPSYWRPNAEIHSCHACHLSFENTELKRHHCRGCGEGFCNACALHRRAVPGRGWPKPVRVCNDCKEILFRTPDASPGEKQLQPRTSSAGGVQLPSEEQDVLARKYGEVILNTFSTVAAALEYPKDLIKDSVRPSYWVPDVESPDCSVCKLPFGTAEELTAAASPNHRNHQQLVICNRTRHHCRACGLAVCNNCSLARAPVPERGWTTDVRVCDGCINRVKCGGNV